MKDSLREIHSEKNSLKENFHGEKLSRKNYEGKTLSERSAKRKLVQRKVVLRFERGVSMFIQISRLNFSEKRRSVIQLKVLMSSNYRLLNIKLSCKSLIICQLKPDNESINPLVCTLVPLVN